MHGDDSGIGGHGNLGPLQPLPASRILYCSLCTGHLISRSSRKHHHRPPCRNSRLFTTLEHGLSPLLMTLPTSAARPEAPANEAGRARCTLLRCCVTQEGSPLHACSLHPSSWARPQDLSPVADTPPFVAVARVLVRFRPLGPAERPDSCVECTSGTAVQHTSTDGSTLGFSFDAVLGQDATQAQVPQHACACRVLASQRTAPTAFKTCQTLHVSSALCRCLSGWQILCAPRWRERTARSWHMARQVLAGSDMVIVTGALASLHVHCMSTCTYTCVHLTCRVWQDTHADRGCQQ